MTARMKTAATCLMVVALAGCSGSVMPDDESQAAIGDSGGVKGVFTNGDPLAGQFAWLEFAGTTLRGELCLSDRCATSVGVSGSDFFHGPIGHVEHQPLKLVKPHVAVEPSCAPLAERFTSLGDGSVVPVPAVLDTTHGPLLTLDDLCHAPGANSYAMSAGEVIFKAQ
jgi:hypothetical protein